MFTEKEIESVLNSDRVDLDEVLSGPLRIEDMEGYFRRELKENLLEQGWELPQELKDPDDDDAPVPEYLRERPDPDTRSRYSGEYDGGEEDEEPHYGGALYIQFQAVKHGRLAYPRAYDIDGKEMKMSKKLYGKVLIQVYDHLLGTLKNPICHNGYEFFMIKRDELDLDEMPDGLAFVTVYLF